MKWRELLKMARCEVVGVEVGEKTTYWLHVGAHWPVRECVAAHSGSEPNRMVRQRSKRILRYRTPLESYARR